MVKVWKNKILQLVQNSTKYYETGDYSASLLETKRAIEQICISALRVHGIFPEQYTPKTNRHHVWGLEKLIDECEENNLVPVDLASTLKLIKDWRNTTEHSGMSSVPKTVAELALFGLKQLYGHLQNQLKLEEIQFWPLISRSSPGNMLAISPKGVSMKDGRMVVQGDKGEILTIDFLDDSSTLVDETGQKQFYKGNISERNDNKGWIK